MPKDQNLIYALTNTTRGSSGCSNWRCLQASRSDYSSGSWHQWHNDLGVHRGAGLYHIFMLGGAPRRM